MSEIRKKKNKRNPQMKELVIILKKNRGLYILITLLMIVSAALSLGTSSVMLHILDESIPSKNIRTLVIFVSAYFMIEVLKQITELSRNYFYVKITNSIMIDIKTRIVENLFRKNGKYYSENSAGEILSVINMDTAELQGLITDKVFQTVSNVVVSVGMAVYLFVLQWDLALVLLVVQPLMAVVQSAFQKKVEKAAVSCRESYGKNNSVITEFVSNVQQFISMNLRSFFMKRYRSSLDDLAESTLKRNLVFSSVNSIMQICSVVSTILIIGLGSLKVIKGTMSVGMIIVFMQYSQTLLDPFYQLFEMKNEIVSKKPSIERLSAMMSSGEDSVSDNGIIAYRFSEKDVLKFNNVVFSYNEDMKHIVLNKADMMFSPGNIYALTGRTGSGKSSVVNLLLRFWECNSGSIKLNGIRLDKYSLKDIRDSIKYVSQNTLILNDTIYNNIVLGRTDIAREDVISAVEKSGLAVDIEKMSDGLDTMLSDGGSNLSGGQRQRISLARAFVRKGKSIVILDEPTSALDKETEKSVMESIKEAFSDSIVILISHSPYVIEECDAIYNISDGKVSFRRNLPSEKIA